MSVNIDTFEVLYETNPKGEKKGNIGNYQPWSEEISGSLKPFSYALM